MITPKNINQFRQNKPTLIVDDVCATEHITRDSIYDILLSRGIFKWFSVRRKLIKLKEHWKDRLKTAADYQIIAKGIGRWNRVWYWRGYRRALEECRADVRALCHSPRWQAQDNDSEAAKWLYRKEDELKLKVLEEVIKDNPIPEPLILPSCEGSSSEISQDAMGNLRGIG